MKVYHYLPSDVWRGGGGGGGTHKYWLMVTWAEGSPKIAIFAVTSFLNGPWLEYLFVKFQVFAINRTENYYKGTAPYITLKIW